MTLLLRLIIVLMLVLLVACGKTPQSSAQTENPSFQVDTLFVKDGCTVYRFKDNFRFVYFTRCVRGESKTKWDEPCGKACTRPVEVSTYQSQQP